MSTLGSGKGPDDRDDTWTSETLPMAVRRDLLERELRKLGFRKPDSGGSGRVSSLQQQQQPPAPTVHPQADADGGNHSN